MITTLMILLSSLWAILIVEELTPYQQLTNYIGLGPIRRLKSEYDVVDYILFLIWKLLNCPMCMSAHLFWITYLIAFSSLFGLLLCPIPYFMTFIIKKYILTIRL